MLTKTRLHVAIAGALALGTGTAFAGSFSAEEIPAPMQPQPVPDMTEPSKHEVHSSPAAVINGFLEPTGFRTLLRSGDQLAKLGATGETERFGKLYMADGTALVDEGAGGCLDFAARDESCNDAISNSNDFNSLHQVGEDLYLVSHFETRPGAMYLTKLEQDAEGNLSPLATRLIDFSGVYGGWVHCAGTVTPWNTHMGSEEYEPDARGWVDSSVGIGGYNSAMAAYYDATGWTFNANNPEGSDAVAQTVMNPYRYGYPVEVAVNADGSTDVTKHFALGRTANELSIVMPDNKTVYITDDGTNTMLVMFVADEAGDLSSGSLYGGIWNQISDTPEGGRGWLSWINLGHADAEDILAAIDGAHDEVDGWEVEFDDMFDYADPNPDGSCPDGLTSVNSGHGGPYQECLAYKTDVVGEDVISRLETRRYAALKGATTEFRKVEGASYDASRRVLYMAISDIGSGMTDGHPTYDAGGYNHIRLDANKCGAIYELRMSSRARDTDGNDIPSRYVARTMTGILAGEQVAAEGDNQCSLDGIGNPDNITFLPGYNLLVIGEDAGNSVHQIDMVWAYDMREKALTRIQSTPFGSETTSVYFYPNLNGWGYLMSVVQHPYGESDPDELPYSPQGEAGKYGYVGYFKFPALD
jgi:secreted PhoX family phosphatase